MHTIRILIYFFCFCSSAIIAQDQLSYTLYFERGKAQINLDQLDSIKQLLKAFRTDFESHIMVNVFADDALDENNNKLSLQRALLIKQCIQREGVSNKFIHLYNRVHQSRSNKDACNHCAEILILKDPEFYDEFDFQQNLNNYLDKKSSARLIQYKINPLKNSFIFTEKGLFIFFPANCLETSNSSPVTVKIRECRKLEDFILHKLSKRNLDDIFLSTDYAISIEAEQEGHAISVKKNNAITLISPSDQFYEHSTLFEKEGLNWSAVNQQKPLLILPYDNAHLICKPPAIQIDSPDYPLSPVRANYFDIDSACKGIQLQLDAIELRLSSFSDEEEAGVRQNKKIQLEQKKDKLLIALEKKKSALRTKNQAIDEVYYHELRSYNKKRNELQLQHLKNIELLKTNRADLLKRCELAKSNDSIIQNKEPKQVLDFIKRKLLTAEIEQKYAYWTSTDRLGWLCIGQLLDLDNKLKIPYRIKTKVNAFSVQAMLIYNEELVIGEAEDKETLVFWDIPESAKIKILAMQKDNKGIKIAKHTCLANSDELQLDFKKADFKEILKFIQ